MIFFETYPNNYWLETKLLGVTKQLNNMKFAGELEIRKHQDFNYGNLKNVLLLDSIWKSVLQSMN